MKRFHLGLEQAELMFKIQEASQSNFEVTVAGWIDQLKQTPKPLSPRNTRKRSFRVQPVSVQQHTPADQQPQEVEAEPVSNPKVKRKLEAAGVPTSPKKQRTNSFRSSTTGAKRKLK